MIASSIVAKETVGGSIGSVPEFAMTKKYSPPEGDSSPENASRPLDKLMAKRSKPFRDWKEEREYLRRKWGPQGRRIEPGKRKKGEESSPDA